MSIRPFGSKSSSGSGFAAPLDRHILCGGDSRTANGHSGSAPNEIAENYGYTSWLNQYTSGRVLVVKARNYGVGGDTTAMWLARVPAMIATGAKVMVTLIGTNDRGGVDLPLEVSKRNIEAGIRMQLESGIIPIVVAELPRGGANALTGTKLANHLALRDWIKSYFPTIGVRVADPWVELIDPANASAGLPLAGYFHDGLHPTPSGARVIGKHIATQLMDLYPAALVLPTAEVAYDATNSVTGSLNVNSMCTGTAGSPSAGANATGQLADGWSLFGSSFTGVTLGLSKETNPVAGEYQVFNPGGTPSSTGSYFSFEQTISLANLASGDKVKAVAMVSFENLAGIAGVSLDIRFTRGGVTSYVKHCDRYLETTPMDASKVVGPYETSVLTLDGTETDIKIRFVCYGCQGLALAGTIKVGQINLIKVLN